MTNGGKEMRSARGCCGGGGLWWWVWGGGGVRAGSVGRGSEFVGGVEGRACWACEVMSESALGSVRIYLVDGG